MVAALTGAVVFLSDLMRQLPLRLVLRLVNVSSYPGRATRSQGPRCSEADLGDLAGGPVLVVDDILDGGGTLGVLLENLGSVFLGFGVAGDGTVHLRNWSLWITSLDFSRFGRENRSKAGLPAERGQFAALIMTETAFHSS